jgi:imidazolonepropionase-like amidohydrolase
MSRHHVSVRAKAISCGIALALAFAGSIQRASAAVTVLEGARLIDGTGRPAIDRAVLVVDGDHIVSVGTADKTPRPEGARVIDLRGRTIMPGIINAHGHLGLVVGKENRADGYTRENVTRQLEQYEQYGVTTMQSLGLNRDLVYELRDEQRHGQLAGATIFTAGRGIGVPSGFPPMPVAADQLYLPRTADEAREDVRALAARHADIIKLWVDDGGKRPTSNPAAKPVGKYPKMQPEIYAAVIEEAHQNKLRVAAHEYYLADAKSLVADGIDVLAHSIRDQQVDQELIDQMKVRGVFYIPTLMVDESFFIFAEQPEVMDDAFFKEAVGPELRTYLASPEYRDKAEHDLSLQRNKAALAIGMRNLKRLYDAGISVAFGTDSGAMPTRIQGWAEHHELELLVRSGLTPMQAIVLATHGSATLLHAPDRGTLEAGKRADFLILAASPLDDIRNTRKLVSIWHDGREIKPRVAAASTP